MNYQVEIGSNNEVKTDPPFALDFDPLYAATIGMRFWVSQV
jgi:hypothetical protein